MSELENNVLDDYDELMDFGHDTIGDLKYDLNKLKIRDRIQQLQKENAELKKQNELMNCTINEMSYEIECHKKQITDIKYLDRGKLRNLIFKYPADEINEKELIDDICKLALPIREKIIEVLEKYQIREIEKFTPQNKGKERCVWEREPEQIASEILERKQDEK